MDSHRYAVIMAGGVGSRLWPYSREATPKQFLDLLGTGRSLLQMTYDRFTAVCPPENIFVVTSQQYGPGVAEQLPALSQDQILLEPHRRNTAPCIAFACYKIAAKDPEAKIVVTPSDHAIFKENAFYQVLEQAFTGAQDTQKLITIGIEPTRPETGYGYIQYDAGTEAPLKAVKTFTEKPQLEFAKKFLESGDFVWNAGIFVWHAQAIIQAFEKHLPDIAEAFQGAEERFFTAQENAFVAEAYSQCISISVDYGIMEKANNVYVVLGNFGWSDLGSWNSLYENRSKNEQGNVVQGNAIVLDSTDCIIMSQTEGLTVVQGLEGYLVANINGTVVVCKKANEKQYRDLVNLVKKEKGEGYM